MYSALVLIGLLSLIPVSVANPIALPGTSLVPRQYIPGYAPKDSCCKAKCDLELAGNNGNYHKIFHYQQVTEPIDCTDGKCSATYTDTYTIGFWIGGGLNVGFFSGGFDVSQSWSKAKGYSCDADPGQKVCVWMAVAHAEYLVTAPESQPICEWH